MYKSYESACPFYAKEDALNIVCSSWDDSFKIRLNFMFGQTEKKRQHVLTHCRDVDGCTDCPVYQMIDFEYDCKGKNKAP